MTNTIHRLVLGALALGCIAPGCHSDPLPDSGTLVMRQVGSRLGDTADELGVLVVGQSVCGTHIALDAEAGEFTIFGGTRRTSACVKPPSHTSPQSIELIVYPTETAALLHARLLIEPKACATLPESCKHLCVNVPDDKAEDTDTDTDAINEGRPVTDACPSDARLVDQATLLVSAVLPEASAGSTSTSSSGSTTTAASDTDTDSAGTTGTSTGDETEGGTTSATTTGGSEDESSTGTTSEDTSSTT